MIFTRDLSPSMLYTITGPTSDIATNIPYCPIHSRDEYRGLPASRAVQFDSTVVLRSVRLGDLMGLPMPIIFNSGLKSANKLKYGHQLL